MKKTTIEVVVGNMLKVMKSGRPIIKHREAFNKIRHGDYDNFIKIIDEPTPSILIYNNGVIKNSYSSQKEDSDFAGLISSEPSLIKFHKDCLNEYGIIEDTDIPDDIFEKMVLFEISLRMHSNNHNLIKNEDNLIVVIDKLSEFKELTNEDKEILHNGRIFLNGVKRNKLKFPSWEQGKFIFLDAYNTLVNNQLTIL